MQRHRIEFSSLCFLLVLYWNAAFHRSAYLRAVQSSTFSTFGAQYQSLLNYRVRSSDLSLAKFNDNDYYSNSQSQSVELSPSDIFLCLLESQLAIIVQSTNITHAAVYISSESDDLREAEDEPVMQLVCSYPPTLRVDNDRMSSILDDDDDFDDHNDSYESDMNNISNDDDFHDDDDNHDDGDGIHTGNGSRSERSSTGSYRNNDQGRSSGSSSSSKSKKGSSSGSGSGRSRSRSMSSTGSDSKDNSNNNDNDSSNYNGNGNENNIDDTVYRDDTDSDSDSDPVLKSPGGRASGVTIYSIQHRGINLGILQTLINKDFLYDDLTQNIPVFDFYDSQRSSSFSAWNPYRADNAQSGCAVCESVACSMGASIALEMTRIAGLMEVRSENRLLREREDNVFLRSSSALITTKTLLKMLSKRLPKDDEIGLEMIKTIADQSHSISDAILELLKPLKESDRDLDLDSEENESEEEVEEEEYYQRQEDDVLQNTDTESQSFEINGRGNEVEVEVEVIIDVENEEDIEDMDITAIRDLSEIPYIVRTLESAHPIHSDRLNDPRVDRVASSHFFPHGDEAQVPLDVDVVVPLDATVTGIQNKTKNKSKSKGNALEDDNEEEGEIDLKFLEQCCTKEEESFVVFDLVDGTGSGMGLGQSTQTNEEEIQSPPKGTKIKKEKIEKISKSKGSKEEVASKKVKKGIAQK